MHPRGEQCRVCIQMPAHDLEQLREVFGRSFHRYVLRAGLNQAQGMPLYVIPRHVNHSTIGQCGQTPFLMNAAAETRVLVSHMTPWLGLAHDPRHSLLSFDFLVFYL